MSTRTFRVVSPHMSGDDVLQWQGALQSKLAHWGAHNYPLVVDGGYGVTARDACATVLYGLGIARDEMAAGVTPALRLKVRHAALSAEERMRYAERAGWRARLAVQHRGGGTASPLAKILTHAHGWLPGHDGVDLICAPRAVGHALCRARVRRADADGWWGLGAPADPVLRGRGDGIVVLEALVNLGPIHQGMFFGYGHAENASVRVGQAVEAGEPICAAGFANAWHFHFLINAGGRAFERPDGSPRGVGDRDPWPVLAFCILNA